jgi:hypothetical protein
VLGELDVKGVFERQHDCHVGVRGQAPSEKVVVVVQVGHRDKEPAISDQDPPHFVAESARGTGYRHAQQGGLTREPDTSRLPACTLGPMSAEAPPRLTPVLVRMLEGRVGSTALMRLLATSPEIAFERVYPFEKSYLTYLTRLAGQLSLRPAKAGAMLELVYDSGDHIGPLPFHDGMVDTDELARRSLAALWGSLCCSLTGQPSPAPRYYAEKYWGQMGPLLDAGLRPVVIDLVRDPRDVIASIRAYNARKSHRLFGRPAAADDWEHLRRLVLGMALRLQELGQPLPVPSILLRYEDFVADIPGHAAQLESLLGVALDAGALVSDTEVLQQHKTSQSVEASVGRWRAELAPREVGLIERRLGPAMKRLGYL